MDSSNEFHVIGGGLSQPHRGGADGAADSRETAPEGTEDVADEVDEVPGRIDVDDRVVPRIGVAVERLRVAHRGHDRIRADKPPDGGIIVACAEVVETQLFVELL